MTAPRPAAFLDRDGVINVDTGYTHRVEDLVFTPTAIEGIRLFNRAGYWVIVATNQSGVARGLYGLADVDRFHAAIAEHVAAEDARIDAFYVSPWYPGGSVSAFAREHEDRKPGPGMLLRAMREFPVRREGSVMIGDRQSDIDAATAAGLPGLLVPRDRCDLAATARDWLAAQS